MDLSSKIRNVPDFPKPGIMFKDITTLLHDGPAFKHVIDGMAARYRGKGLTKIVGIESRGFVFGAALAYELGIGFVPVRKAGKLPAATIKRSYALEYGEATIELHKDALTKADRVLVVDDLLATGGTLEAAAALVEDCGASIVEVWVLIELAFLPGRKKLAKYPLHAELVVDGE